MTESFEHARTPKVNRLPEVSSDAVRSLAAKIGPGWNAFRLKTLFELSRQNPVLVNQVLGVMYASGLLPTAELEDVTYSSMLLTHELLAAQAEIDNLPARKPSGYRLPIVQDEITTALEADVVELGLTTVVAAASDTIVDNNPRIVDKVRQFTEGFYANGGAPASMAANAAMQLTYMLLDRQALADEMSGIVYGPAPEQP